jgi:hypothetical protein
LPVAGVAGLTALGITVVERRGHDEHSEGNASMYSDSNNRSRSLRKVLAALFILAAALLVIGTARERSLRHSETHRETTATEPAHVEGGDADHHNTEGAHATATTETSEGRVLGTDLEAWPIVLAFVAASLGLAIALIRSQSTAVVAVAGLIAAVASVFDIAEIVHQANESHTSLVLIATGVAALHLAAAAVAALILNAETHRGSDDRTVPAQAG